MFSLNVLLFGNHPRLAQRCLQSVRANLSSAVNEVRIGLNSVSPQTLQLVHRIFSGASCPVWLYESSVNVWKYPLMRRMFYDVDRPITAPLICWFDDDSYFKGVNPQRWEQYARLLGVGGSREQYDMLGRIYCREFQGRMADIIRQQPWYRGLPFQKNKRGKPAMYFATGGWWVVRREILTRWDWPWAVLKHNGGDCTLGELFYQQNLRLKNFHDEVAINADERQGGDSTARPRAKHQRLVWSDGITVPPAAPFVLNINQIN